MAQQQAAKHQHQRTNGKTPLTFGEVGREMRRLRDMLAPPGQATAAELAYAERYAQRGVQREAAEVALATKAAKAQLAFGYSTTPQAPRRTHTGSGRPGARRTTSATGDSGDSDPPDEPADRGVGSLADVHRQLLELSRGLADGIALLPRDGVDLARLRLGLCHSDLDRLIHLLERFGVRT